MVGIALCIIGTMLYFMIRNYFLRNRLRSDYRRDFTELRNGELAQAANGGGVGANGEAR